MEKTIKDLEIKTSSSRTLHLFPKTMDWQSVWHHEVEPAVHSLLSCQQTDCSVLFSAVYKITTARSNPSELHPAECLYSSLSSLFVEHCQMIVNRELTANLVPSQISLSLTDDADSSDPSHPATTLNDDLQPDLTPSSSPNPHFLDRYIHCWKKFESGALALNSAFHFFNSRWITKKQALNPHTMPLSGLANPYTPARTISPPTTYWTIGHLAMQTWKTHVLIPLGPSLIAALTCTLQQDRTHDSPFLSRSPADDPIVEYANHLRRINEPEPVSHLVEHGRHLPSFFANMPGWRSTPPQDKNQHFQHYFASPFFEETRTFFTQKYRALVEAQPFREFAVACAEDLRNEHLRQQRYLPPCLQEPFSVLLAEAIVQPHFAHHVEFFQQALAASCYDDLELIFNICCQIPEAFGLQKISSIFADAIAQAGTARLQAMTTDANGAYDCFDLLQKVSSLHEQSTKQLNSCFHRHSLFSTAIDQAFLRFLNTPPEHDLDPAQLLAQFADAFLKGSPEVALLFPTPTDQIMLIFSYLNAKDQFKTFYAKYMARRLVQNSSISLNAEQELLSAFQSSCGFEFTSNLQKMLTDIINTNDVNAQFSQWLQDDCPSLPTLLADHQFSFRVLLLSFGSWPLQPSPAVTLLPQLQDCLNTFTTFHTSLSTHPKKLTWLHHVSHGTLVTRFTHRKYSFRVSDFQIAILLLFNDRSLFTMEDICQHTGMNVNQCKKILFSLVVTKILRKDPPTREFQPSDRYSLNFKFQNKKTNLDAMRVLTRESEESRPRRSNAEVNLEALQAFLIRQLKMKKIETLQNLILTASNQGNNTFIPSHSMIVSALGVLISKGLIKKVENLSETYQYIS